MHRLFNGHQSLLRRSGLHQAFVGLEILHHRLNLCPRAQELIGQLLANSLSGLFFSRCQARGQFSLHLRRCLGFRAKRADVPSVLIELAAGLLQLFHQKFHGSLLGVDEAHGMIQ